MNEQERRRTLIEVGFAVGAILASVVIGVLLVNLPVLHPDVRDADEPFPIFATPTSTPTRDTFSVGTTPTPRDTVVPTGISSPAVGPSGAPSSRVTGSAASDGTTPTRRAPVAPRPSHAPSTAASAPPRPSVPVPAPSISLTPPTAVPCIVSVLHLCVRL